MHDSVRNSEYPGQLSMLFPMSHVKEVHLRTNLTRTSYLTPDPFIKTETFPDLFTHAVNAKGLITEPDLESKPAQQVSLLTRLHSTPQLCDFINAYADHFSGREAHRVQHLVSEKYALDDIVGWAEDLKELADEYAE